MRNRDSSKHAQCSHIFGPPLRSLGSSSFTEEAPQEGVRPWHFCKFHLTSLHTLLLEQAALVMGGVRSGLIHRVGYK